MNVQNDRTANQQSLRSSKSVPTGYFKHARHVADLSRCWSLIRSSAALTLIFVEPSVKINGAYYSDVTRTDSGNAAIRVIVGDVYVSIARHLVCQMMDVM